VCLAIAKNPADARRLTIKRNTVAVVTDGSAVLGLGNIGPAAALPVMEGKAALFKRFAGVDAWPVCLDTQDADEIVQIVKAIAPVYGGINLEDISAPRCFEIERRLRAELDIPVFHDDQHGTAIVVLAALINALRVVDKDIAYVQIVVSGTGAAGSVIIRLLHQQGATKIIGCDKDGASSIKLGPMTAPCDTGWWPTLISTSEPAPFAMFCLGPTYSSASPPPIC
jgi:malate dehydrogenase (oxaloacetate-decarboxylating)